jgi:hypothetical protein
VNTLELVELHYLIKNVSHTNQVILARLEAGGQFHGAGAGADCAGC